MVFGESPSKTMYLVCKKARAEATFSAQRSLQIVSLRSLLKTLFGEIDVLESQVILGSLAKWDHRFRVCTQKAIQVTFIDEIKDGKSGSGLNFQEPQTVSVL